VYVCYVLQTGGGGGGMMVLIMTMDVSMIHMFAWTGKLEATVHFGFKSRLTFFSTDKRNSCSTQGKFNSWVHIGTCNHAS
jgi:hypothetical protein